ncbi:hypothetical protein RRF57_000353 [Xylaria bambusicola]|uniref:Uncharacterized protein n=1 Tax=Xylaria bambusicola TaxID=326684 RepID=A0AAN7Z0L7_9PEZI
MSPGKPRTPEIEENIMKISKSISLVSWCKFHRPSTFGAKVVAHFSGVKVDRTPESVTPAAWTTPRNGRSATVKVSDVDANDGGFGAQAFKFSHKCISTGGFHAAPRRQNQVTNSMEAHQPPGYTASKITESTRHQHGAVGPEQWLLSWL